MQSVICTVYYFVLHLSFVNFIRKIECFDIADYQISYRIF